MNISCEVILDLIPLVKDNAASEESINLVSEHLKSCESCKLEFESHSLFMQKEVDDIEVLSSINRKLLFIESTLLLAGGFLGMALSQKTPLSLMQIILIIVGMAFLGILIFNFDFKGGYGMRRFFIGKAIGTVIIFAILGIYLLLKYALHLF